MKLLPCVITLMLAACTTAPKKESPRVPASNSTDKSVAPSVSYEQANCKVKSTIDQYRYAYIFIEDQANHDIEFAQCLDSQRQAVLANVTESDAQENTPSYTRIRDVGFVEFHTPGKPDEISRCTYVVEKDQAVSTDLVKLVHGKLQLKTDMGEAMKQYRQLTKEAKKLVSVECLIS